MEQTVDAADRSLDNARRDAPIRGDQDEIMSLIESGELERMAAAQVAADEGFDDSDDLDDSLTSNESFDTPGSIPVAGVGPLGEPTPPAPYTPPGAVTRAPADGKPGEPVPLTADDSSTPQKGVAATDQSPVSQFVPKTRLNEVIEERNTLRELRDNYHPIISALEKVPGDTVEVKVSNFLNGYAQEVIQQMNADGYGGMGPSPEGQFIPQSGFMPSTGAPASPQVDDRVQKLEMSIEDLHAQKATAEIETQIATALHQHPELGDFGARSIRNSLAAGDPRPISELAAEAARYVKGVSDQSRSSYLDGKRSASQLHAQPRRGGPAPAGTREVRQKIINMSDSERREAAGEYAARLMRRS